MALVKCPDCGKEISDKATACIHCGCPASATTEPQTESNTVFAEDLSDVNQKTSEIEQYPKSKTDKKTSNKQVISKKGIIVIVAVIAVISIFAILILTHIICLDHEFSDATVLEPQTCYHCGKTKGEPKDLMKIEFPSKGVGSLLPIPKSNMGEINWDDTDSFNVYVGNTTKNDFNTYVKQCSDYGFYVDYQKGDDYYYADDINGNNLNIWYKGNNIIEIQIIAPNENTEIDEDGQTNQQSGEISGEAETQNNTDDNSDEPKESENITTFVDDNHFSFYPAEFAKRFDNAFGNIRGYSFESEIVYDDTKMFYDEDNLLFYEIKDGSRTVGMYSFSKGNDISVPYHEEYTKGCAVGVNILIEDSNDVSPIVYATMLAIDPSLNSETEEELYNSIIDNVGNMEVVTYNSINYLLYKESGYPGHHYLIVTVAE